MAAGWGFLSSYIDSCRSTMRIATARNPSRILAITKETEIMTVETQGVVPRSLDPVYFRSLHHIWPAAGLWVVAVIATVAWSVSKTASPMLRTRILPSSRRTPPHVDAHYI